MTFQECAIECIKNDEFVKQFNRLTDSKLGIDNRSMIEKMIDKACNYDNGQSKDFEKFMDCVYEYIWLPLVDGKTFI